MKIFSVSVPDSDDFEVFRDPRQDKEPLTDLPVLSGHRLVEELPPRTEVWDEILPSDEIRASFSHTLGRATV